MNIDWAPLLKAVAPLWEKARPLVTEHSFLTIVCGFFTVMMTISFYRFLRSISPALVGLIMLVVLSILMMHWTFTRTEPAFLKPMIDVIAPFFPTGAARPGPIL